MNHGAVFLDCRIGEGESVLAWNAEQIIRQSHESAYADYAAFEAIGLHAIPHARVLDVGCFNGYNSYQKFASYANIDQVTGIDPLEDGIREARSRVEDGRFSFLCTTFEDMPEGELFDVIYFSHVLQHLACPEEAVAKAFRLLEPGGFIIVKTVDDSAKESYPDPARVLERLMSLYEHYVLPLAPWTADTDRHLGGKCFTVLSNAGFTGVGITHFVEDTAGKTAAERQALFDRCMHFRTNFPPGAEEFATEEIVRLGIRLNDMFMDESYYFSTTVYVAIGRKPIDDATEPPYRCEAYGVSGKRACIPESERLVDGERRLSVRSLLESDLSQVMSIELDSFPSPWTPLAYVTEMRHNGNAHYLALVDEGGRVVAYAGYWVVGEEAHLVRIAVNRERRKAGLGRLMLEEAIGSASSNGCTHMVLEVRASNAGARALYRASGFAEVKAVEGHYTDPDEAAIVLFREFDEGLFRGRSEDAGREAALAESDARENREAEL